MAKLIESLQKCSLDKILSIREKIGATLDDVYLVTRTWRGERPGDGPFKDKKTKVWPVPAILDYSHNLRLQEGGSIKQGDLLLKSISREQYPDEASLRTDTGTRNVEKFYKIGDHYYRSIHIKKNYLTWDIQVRKTNATEQLRNG